jgi:hypothetical protein
MKKAVLLFLALLLPACIFLFLRIFGKNEFNVEPLFQDSKEKIIRAECGEITLPYKIPSRVLSELITAKDSLAIICFDTPDEDPKFRKLKEELGSEPVHFEISHPGNEARASWYECVFLMTQPADIVVVDRTGTIRGQYNSEDRDEIDRLKTEITILLKKY